MNSPWKALPHPTPESLDKDIDGWQSRERLYKSEAEQLLDWLEANGFSQRKVSIAEDGTFTVHWRR
jgi:hypothetical protein